MSNPALGLTLKPKSTGFADPRVWPELLKDTPCWFSVDSTLRFGGLIGFRAENKKISISKVYNSRLIIHI